jgi:hypothetical protein
MEHRETPRRVTAEGRPRDPTAESSEDGRRFARFVASPTERRLVLGRLALAVFASVLGLLAAGGVGTVLWERMVDWLHSRPQYQTTFGAIRLEPPPPPWFRGGSRVFLDRVGRTAQRPDGPFSALDVSLPDLAREFLHYCWVKRVVKVERHPPNQLIVRLEYYVPVAWWSASTRRTDRVLVDEDGVILPDEDVEEDPSEPLIQLIGLDPPSEPRPGRLWKTSDDSESPGKANGRVLAAAKLAAYLRSALRREPKPIPAALRPVAIQVIGEGDRSFVFVENAEKTMIYWAEPPTLETPGNRTAGQRWADLKDWVRRHPDDPPIQKPFYLDFSKDGVVVKRGRG